MAKDKAITLNEIITLLKSREVFFSFEKSNGEIRNMWATLNEDIIPGSKDPNAESTLQKKIAEGKLTALPVWDCEANDWRSFRLSSLLDFDGVDVQYAGNK